MPDASVNRSILSEKDKLMVLMSVGDSLEQRMKSVEVGSDSQTLSPHLGTSPFSLCSPSAEFPSKTQTHHRTAASFAYDLVFPRSHSGKRASEIVTEDVGETLKVKNFNIKYANVITAEDVHAGEGQENLENSEDGRRQSKASSIGHECANAESGKTRSSSTAEPGFASQDGEQKSQNKREVFKSNVVVSAGDLRPKVTKFEETEIDRLRREKLLLQSYISSVACRMYGSTSTKNAQEQTEGCIEITYEEQEHHFRTIHLLEEKLSALESVLDIQERCLTNNTSDDQIRAQNAKARFKDLRKTMSVGDFLVDEAPNIETLLKRWRTKVFELLLQSKLTSETFEHERRTFHAKALTLAEKLNRVELDMAVQEQKFKAAQREVNLMKYNLEVANQKIADLEKAKRNAEQKTSAQSELIENLALRLESVPIWMSTMDSLSNTIEERLSTYGNRLAFANDRTRIIRECLSKR